MEEVPSLHHALRVQVEATPGNRAEKGGLPGACGPVLPKLCPKAGLGALTTEAGMCHGSQNSHGRQEAKLII